MITIGEWLARIGIMSMTLGFVTWMLLTYDPENLELWKKTTPILFFGGFALTVIAIILLGGV